MITKPKRAVLICQLLHYLIGVATMVLSGLGVRRNVETWSTKQSHVFDAVVDMSREFSQPEFVRLWLLMTLQQTVVALIALAAVVSATFMGKRRNRRFSLFVAGLFCLTSVLGLGVGLFTIWVLTRTEVREHYTLALR